MADQSLDRFRETHTNEQQQFIVFVETGEIPTGESFGIEQIEADVGEAPSRCTFRGTCWHPQGLLWHIGWTA